MALTTLSSSLVFAASLLWAGAACAQEKDWSLSAGLKLWSTKWQSGVLDNVSPGDDNFISLESQRKQVPVGTADLRYKELLLSASYFKRTAYSFPAANDGAVSGIGARIERSQYDLGLGWLVVPQLALTFGYKNVRLKYTESTLNIDAGTTATYDAYVVGFSGSAPLSRGLSIYGSVGTGPAKLKYSTGASSSGTYAAMEIGLGYALRRDLTATAGYRSETLKTSAPSTAAGTQTNRDVLSGFLVGLNYTFF